MNNPTKPNSQKLNTKLQKGLENLSGYSMEGITVHYNSSKPHQLQAHAYVQGKDIYLAPGQEQHLAHEAWHIVQNMQARVAPTQTLRGLPICQVAHLEEEATFMGQKALELAAQPSASTPYALQHTPVHHATVIQRTIEGYDDDEKSAETFQNDLKNEFYGMLCDEIEKIDSQYDQAYDRAQDLAVSTAKLLNGDKATKYTEEAARTKCIDLLTRALKFMPGKGFKSVNIYIRELGKYIEVLYQQDLAAPPAPPVDMVSFPFGDVLELPSFKNMRLQGYVSQNKGKTGKEFDFLTSLEDIKECGPVIVSTAAELLNHKSYVDLKDLSPQNINNQYKQNPNEKNMKTLEGTKLKVDNNKKLECRYVGVGILTIGDPDDKIKQRIITGGRNCSQDLKKIDNNFHGEAFMVAAWRAVLEYAKKNKQDLFKEKKYIYNAIIIHLTSKQTECCSISCEPMLEKFMEELKQDFGGAEATWRNQR